MNENKMFELLESIEVSLRAMKSVDNYATLMLGRPYSDRSLDHHVQKCLEQVKELQAHTSFTASKRETLFKYAQEMCSLLATGIMPNSSDAEPVQSLESLGFRPLLIHHMRKAGIHDVKALLACSWRDLYCSPGFGKEKMIEIQRVLASHGLYKKDYN